MELSPILKLALAESGEDPPESQRGEEGPPPRASERKRGSIKPPAKPCRVLTFLAFVIVMTFLAWVMQEGIRLLEEISKNEEFVAILSRKLFPSQEGGEGKVEEERSPLEK